VIRRRASRGGGSPVLWRPREHRFRGRAPAPTPSNHLQEVVQTMIGSLLAAYGSTSGGMSGGYWALVVVIAAVVIAVGVWLFFRMRKRVRLRPPPR
jgi:hypothetical protein